MSWFYDYIAGTYVKKYRNMALELLNIRSGETILEVGFGTGHWLKQIAKFVGESGRVYGIDISSGMTEVSKCRPKEDGLSDRVELYCGTHLKCPIRIINSMPRL